MKKILIKTFVKGIAVTVCAQILTLILSVLCIMFLSDGVLKMIFSLAELMIISGLFINFAYRESSRHRSMFSSGTLKKSLVYPFVMSAGASVPLLLTWTCLVLSASGFLPDLLTAYKMADMYFYFITDLILNICNISQLDFFRLFVLFICTGLPYFIIIPSYFSSFRSGLITKQEKHERKTDAGDIHDE